MNKKIVCTILAFLVTTALGMATNSLNVCYVDDCTVAHKADIYPSATGNSPIIVLIHGGGWNSGSKGNLTSVAQDLQSYGYTVMNINYTLATATEPSYPQAVTDCFTAISYIKGHAGQYNGDSNRVIAFGISSGGQLSEIVGNAVPSVVVADIVFYGPCELYDETLRNNRQNGTSIEQLITWYLGESYDPQNPDLWVAASPYDQITSGTVPTGLWHAYNDTVVPVQQSIDFFNRLQSYHIYCHLTLVPHLAHAFMTNTTHTHEFDGQAVAFLHYLGD